MKIDRLLGIITTLLNIERIKAKDLAEKFEVSIRTIHRDLEDLCMAGIPVITYQGGDGGISIAKSYKLEKNLLTSEELSNIRIGLKSLESISNGNNVKLLLDKFQSSKSEVLSANNSIFIDLSSFYKNSITSKINLLRDSINKSEEVCFDYFSEKGISNRHVEPYYITFKWSAWYLYGFCKLRKDFRLFKLNRMDQLALMESTFVPKTITSDASDLDDYFDKNLQVIKLLLDKSVEYQIVDAYGVNSYLINEDNLIEFDLEYSNYDYAIRTILGFGDKVKVLSPPNIALDIKNTAQNILNLYK
jgi:predicted DNA-binding transcriptional regulator YafY